MPSAADYKAEGNKAFAAKKMVKAVKCYTSALELEKEDQHARAALLSNRSAAYMSLGQLNTALDDANAAVRCRPDWGKAYARVGECFARLQDFNRAETAYKLALEHAEDEPSKVRYQASLNTTQQTHKKARDLDPSPDTETFKAVVNEEESWMARLGQLLNRGFTPEPRGALPMTLMALNCCQKGLAALDDALMRRNPANGQIFGRFQSSAIADLCECILLDETTFFIPAHGKDPNWSINAKLVDLVSFEMNGSNLTKYYSPSPLSADKIIDDLDKRRQTEGDDYIRRAVSSVLVRGHIVHAFFLLSTGDQPSAVTSCKFALSLLEAGAVKWADRDYSQKGMCFKPSFIRLVRTYLLKNLLRAHRDAQIPSAKRTFKLEDIEKLANEILAENDPSKWLHFDGSPDRTAYCLMPQWEAFSSLAYVHIVKARLPVTASPPSATVVFFDLEEARKAADAYKRTVETMPDDWHGKANMMWYRIEAELRAGGLTVKQLQDMVKEASRVEDWVTPIWGPPPSPFEARDVSLAQAKAVQRGGYPATAVLKALPNVLAYGKPDSWDGRDALTEEEWGKKPGEVVLVDLCR